jgi:ABC-2 type transport system permease protein
MNTTPLAPQISVVTSIPMSRLLFWSIKREFWENRALYVVPLAVAALLLAGHLIGPMHSSVHMHAGVSVHGDAMTAYSVIALAIMGATLLVTMFYCADALYNERRDRSILFWKSLPVSDLTAVLAKATVPILVMPLLMFAVIVVAQAVLLLLLSAATLAHGQSAAPLWSNLHFFQSWCILLFHLLAIHGLWYAPIYCWLLMVSAFARRVPILWAVLPPMAVVVLEKIAFNTSYFGHLLAHRFFGAPPREAPFVGHPMSMDSLTLTDLGRFFIDPGLWAGLVVAAAFLALAVWLRRSREAL